MISSHQTEKFYEIFHIFIQKMITGVKNPVKSLMENVGHVAKAGTKNPIGIIENATISIDTDQARVTPPEVIIRTGTVDIELSTQGSDPEFGFKFTVMDPFTFLVKVNIY